MKIRIKGNSVRIRLTRSEVDQFGKEGYIEDCTEFGTNTLTYALQRSTTGDTLAATFEDNKITMLMPETMATVWTNTERVGYDSQMDTTDGKKLYLLLEKDFKCLDETTEDQSDNYENPLTSRH